MSNSSSLQVHAKAACKKLLMLLLLQSVPPPPWEGDGDFGVPFLCSLKRASQSVQQTANDLFIAARLTEDE